MSKLSFGWKALVAVPLVFQLGTPPFASEAPLTLSAAVKQALDRNPEVQQLQHRLRAIVEEMGEAMLRTSYSQILNSSRDFSTAICDHQARLVAQADHVPIHVGAIPWAVESVGKAFEGFFLDRRQGSADRGHDAERPHLFEDLAHPTTLDAHAGKADEIGSGQAGEIDVLDILIDQRHLVMVGNERGQQAEAGDGQIGALAEQPDAVLHPPEGDVEARIDNDDIGHAGLTEAVDLARAYTRNVAMRVPHPAEASTSIRESTASARIGGTSPAMTR